MNLNSRTEAVIPFPAFPTSLSAGESADGIGMRRFGILESDLAIDFAGRNTSALVTQLLQQCVVDPESVLPAEFFSGLSVGKRLEFLLVLAAGERRSPFNFQFKCAGCGQELDFELNLDEIAEMQQEADLAETIEVNIGGDSYMFRKPCGRDQEEWAKMDFPDGRNAAMAMIGSLAVSGELKEEIGPDEIEVIDEAFDEADPLVNPVCRAVCVDCGNQNEFLIDLCDAALAILSRLQQQLIVMVHKLASHYNWSEKEIFEIPHWRREKYLELIAAGR